MVWQAVRGRGTGGGVTGDVVNIVRWWGDR